MVNAVGALDQVDIGLPEAGRKTTQRQCNAVGTTVTGPETVAPKHGLPSQTS